MMAEPFKMYITECVFFFFTHLFTTSIQSHMPDIQNNVYKKDGDIIIGVLSDVHQPDDDGHCIRIQDSGVIERLEAIVFAIEEINSREDILPTIDIGFEILDTCSTQTTTLSQVMRFIPPGNFRSDSCTPSPNSSEVVAVIGTEWSATAVSAAMLYGLIHLPMVSYFATSDDLTDTDLYPYFVRVAPPDRFQVKAIIDLLLYFDWRYVSVLYTDDSYGRNAIKNLMRELTQIQEETPICFANNLAVSSESVSPTDFGHIIDELKPPVNAKVLILILRKHQANGFLGALREAGLTGQFQIIGSDAWGANLDEIDPENLIVAQGSLKVNFHATKVKEFEDYFRSLTVEKNENPWFGEYWEEYQWNVSKLNTHANVSDTHIRTSYTEDFSKQSSISLVIDAVTTIAYAIDSMITNGHSVDDGNLMFQYLINMSFLGTSGWIEFDESGDLPGRYDIATIQLVNDHYQIQEVGTWESMSQTRLRINESRIVWIVNGSESESYVVSMCSLPCQSGHIKINIDVCCWTCFNCSENQITLEDECHTCLDNETVDMNRTMCFAIEPEYMRWGNAWTIALSVMASFGLCISTFVLVMFSKYNKHTLIKASSRELSGIMLFGVFMSFSLVFSIISKPTMTTCLINRIGFMLCFTFTYAPLLVRVNRIYRIFSAGKKSTKRPKFISPRSQIAMVSLLIAVQLLINGIYLLKGNTDVDTVVVEPHVRTILVCHIEFVELVGSLSYNLFLIMCCTFYAFISRKVPTNYNESRFISISAYTTLVIWLGFIPSYFLVSDSLIRASVMSLTMIFSALVTLMFTFIPKLYAIKYLNSDKTQIGTYQVDKTTSSHNSPDKQDGFSTGRNRITPPMPRPPSSVQKDGNESLAIGNMN